MKISKLQTIVKEAKGRGYFKAISLGIKLPDDETQSERIGANSST